MSTILADGIEVDVEEIRDVARRLLADRVDRRAPYAEPPRNEARALFLSMAELGWTQLTLPEEVGGLGLSFTALAPIYEEMGKAVAPVALFPTLASLELLASPQASADARSLCPAIVGGEVKLAVAFTPQGRAAVREGQAELAALSIPADPDTSHLLLLEEGGAAWLVDLAAAGATVRQPEMWDRSRPVIDIVLESAPAIAATVGDPAEPIARVRGHLDLALAWDSLGGARQSLEETIGYMLTRQQFGRQIGSFQALKHRAADHKVAVEVATAFAREATGAFARQAPEAAVRAAQARILANDAYHAMAEDAVQLHGGIGFTWEHDCHLFLKRALLNEMLFETPEARRDRLAAVLFDRVRDQQH